MTNWVKKLDTPKITEDHKHYEPYFHIEIPNGVDSDDIKLLHSRYLKDAYWQGEYEGNLTTPDEKSDLEKVKWVRSKEEGGNWGMFNFDHWSNFTNDEWLKEMFDHFKVKWPGKVYTQVECAMHGKGTRLVVHNDGPIEDGEVTTTFRQAFLQHGVHMTGCITQHIYVLGTDQYPESGMQMHYSDYDNRNLKPVKQVKALPGSYVVFRNTSNSYHSVPKQEVEFPRMLVNMRTFWA